MVGKVGNDGTPRGNRIGLIARLHAERERDREDDREALGNRRDRQAQTCPEEGVSPVPMQMWQRCAKSWCRCGRGAPSPGTDVAIGAPNPGADVGVGEPNPGADVGRGEPSPGADVGRGKPSPGADVGRGEPSPGADVAAVTDPQRVEPRVSDHALHANHHHRDQRRHDTHPSAEAAPTNPQKSSGGARHFRTEFPLRVPGSLGACSRNPCSGMGVQGVRGALLR